MEITIITVCYVILTVMACLFAYVYQRVQFPPELRRVAQKPLLTARVVNQRIISSCFSVPHAEYEIVTSLGREQKRCFRRFRDFHHFYTRMHSILPAGHPALENFPRKRMMMSLTAATIDERRRLLDAFLLNITSTNEGRAALGSFCDLPLTLAPGLPIEQAEMIAQAEVTVDSLIGHWTLEKEHQGVKIYSQRTQEGRKAFKSEVTLDASIDEIWEQVSDANTRKKWDKTIDEGNRIEAFGNTGHDVIQYVTGACAGGAVSSRHFVLRRRVMKSKTGIMCVVAADGNEESIPTKQGSVRVKTMSMRQRIELAEDGKSKLTEILSMEPGGNLPSWLVDNATAAELTTGGVALRSFFEKSR